MTSGEARLGNVNRKQVLVMLGQEEVPTPPKVPVQAPPAPAPAPVSAPAPVVGSVKPVTPSSITVTAPQVNSNPQQQPAQQRIMANLKDGRKVLVLPKNVLAAFQARQKQPAVPTPPKVPLQIASAQPLLQLRKLRSRKRSRI